MQSADEIARNERRKAREDHIKANEDKSKRIDHIDWSTENNLHPFTFDIKKMGTCTRMYKESMKMLEEKINEELKEPDDFSGFYKTKDYD